MINKLGLCGAAIVVCVGCVLAAQASSEPFTAKVTDVAKGDVFTIVKDGKTQAVRVAGVDSPELAQPFGPEAKKFTTDLVLNKEVSIDALGTDEEGRMLASVTLADGKALNQELLAAGMGWFCEKYAVHDKTLSTLAAKAITAKIGLWSGATPLAPWDFRCDARKAKAAVADIKMPEPPKPEAKKVAAKGDLAGIEREEFPKPQAPAISSKDVEKYLDDPIAKQLGVSIAKDANGNMMGVSAGNLSAFPIAAAFGFQDGDILTSVNGDALNNLDRIPQLVEKYKGTTNFQVGVIRNGQQQTITVNIAGLKF